MAKSLIGIEINKIEATVVNKGKISKEIMPENLVDDTGVVSSESLVAFLQGMKKRGGIHGKDCAMVMPDNTSYYRTVSSPILSDAQIKLNLPYEFRNYIGSDSIKYNYDYFIDSIVNDDNGNPMTINMVAAAGLRETIDQYVAIFKRVGYRLKLALPKEVCLINLMKKQANPEKEYCLIGVGYDYTNVYMFKGSQLVSTKVIDIATKQIDLALEEYLHIDEHLAVSYRESNYANCLNATELNEVYEKIAVEVMKTVNFYKYENNESQVNDAYFFDLSYDNEALNKKICERIGFEYKDIKEILPSEYAKNEQAGRCLVSIGLVM